MTVDDDAMELANYALKNGVEVDIYVEHSVDGAVYEAECPAICQSVEDIMEKLTGPGANKESAIDLDDVSEEVQVVEAHPEPSLDIGNEGGLDDITHGEQQVDVVDPDFDIDVEFLDDVNAEPAEDVTNDDGDEESDYYSGSVDGIEFKDSEEERDLGIDDGFEADVQEVEGHPPVQGQPPVQGHPAVDEQPPPTESRKKKKKGTQTSLPTRFSPRLRKCNRQPGDYVENDDQQFEEDEYNSEELYSDLDSDFEEEQGPQFPIFNPATLKKEYKWEVGLEFTSLAVFKQAILEHSVLNGKSVKFVKNDKERVRVACKSDCGFVAYVARVGDSHTFRLKTLQPKHRCGRVFDNKNANTRWVSKVVLDKMRDNHDYKMVEIMDDIRRTYSTGITSWRAFREKQIAKEKAEGDAAKQYTLLWRYSAELRRSNAGNTLKLGLIRPDPTLLPRFGNYYMCLDGCKKGFIAGCRPFIGVDGCHLKTRYGGQLLIAVGRDPNDQYFPLAFGVVETESKATWKWFLKLLLEDIGDVRTNRWVFISDKQKGLVEVFQELLDGVEHRFCLRHLYNNVKKRFGGGTEIRNLMMGAAKATYEQAWRDKMDELRQVSEGAGRPRKLRRREPFEMRRQQRGTTHLRRGLTRQKCGTCQEVGHNNKSCPVRKRILKRVREEDAANVANRDNANGVAQGAANGHDVAENQTEGRNNDAAENTPTNEVVAAANEQGGTTTAANNPENPSPKRRKGKEICKPKALSQPLAPRRSKSKKCAGVKGVTDLVTKKSKILFKGSTSEKPSVDESQPMQPMNPAQLAIYWSNLLKECDLLKKGNEQGGKHPLNDKEDKKGGKNMKKGGKK
ncbi:hypothetical protein RIF29_25648 [Crotalaria pallida]|uniref:Transposase n=1 Tax=Crotalaria pallida TaxID=3830 RepID=A0AAN9EMS3_CROPI